jgi:hypothetical protein
MMDAQTALKFEQVAKLLQTLAERIKRLEDEWNARNQRQAFHLSADDLWDLTHRSRR